MWTLRIRIPEHCFLDENLNQTNTPERLKCDLPDPPLLLSHGTLEDIQPAAVQETPAAPQRLLHQRLQQPVKAVRVT